MARAVARSRARLFPLVATSPPRDAAAVGRLAPCNEGEPRPATHDLVLSPAGDRSSPAGALAPPSRGEAGWASATGGNR